jgi:hypothetical protein
MASKKKPPTSADDLSHAAMVRAVVTQAALGAGIALVDKLMPNIAELHDQELREERMTARPLGIPVDAAEMNLHRAPLRIDVFIGSERQGDPLRVFCPRCGVPMVDAPPPLPRANQSPRIIDEAAWLSIIAHAARCSSGVPEHLWRAVELALVHELRRMGDGDRVELLRAIGRAVRPYSAVAGDELESI